MRLSTYKGVDPFPGDSPYDSALRMEMEFWMKQVSSLLGLDQWSISVSSGVPVDDDSLAECYVRENANEAVIALGPEMFSFPESRRRAALIHELLHVAAHPMTRYARDAVKDELGERWEALFKMTMNHLEERFVDSLAHGLAPAFPPSPLLPSVERLRKNAPGSKAPQKKVVT